MIFIILMIRLWILSAVIFKINQLSNNGRYTHTLTNKLFSTSLILVAFYCNSETIILQFSVSNLNQNSHLPSLGIHIIPTSVLLIKPLTHCPYNYSLLFYIINFYLYTLIILELSCLGLSNMPPASLRRSKKPPNECPGYDTKQSDGKAPVLKLWQM